MQTSRAMTNDRQFLTALGAVFLLVFAAFWLWQSPGLIRGRLTTEEIDRAVDYADKHLYLPPNEKPLALERIRKWAEADDGRPVYMLNIMRYFDAVRPPPGAPEFKGTPKEANALYEREAMPMLFASGNYPIYASETEGANLLNGEGLGDNLSRILVVRYASRRDFLNLLTNPDYPAIEPYKLMALEVALTPTSGDIVIPDARLALGALLLIAFLAIGWVRAARRPIALAPLLGLAPIAVRPTAKVKETL
jgi:hypothetical protein